MMDRTDIQALCDSTENLFEFASTLLVRMHGLYGNHAAEIVEDIEETVLRRGSEPQELQNLQANMRVTLEALEFFQEVCAKIDTFTKQQLKVVS